jgi:hypothetical protein
MYIVMCNSTQTLEGSDVHCNVQQCTDSLVGILIYSGYFVHIICKFHHHIGFLTVKDFSDFRSCRNCFRKKSSVLSVFVC